jgi:hypothetical protein
MKFIEVYAYTGTKQNTEKFIINMNDISYVGPSFKNSEIPEDTASVTVTLKSGGRRFHLTGESSDLLIEEMKK